MKEFIVIDTEEIPYSKDTDTSDYKIILFSKEDSSIYEERATLTWDDYSNNYQRNMVICHSDDYIKNNLTRIRKTIFNPEIDNIWWLFKKEDDSAIKRGRFMEQMKKLTKFYFVPKDKMFNEESLASIAADLAEKIYLDIDHGD